jgi:hypothetical protein
MTKPTPDSQVPYLVHNLEEEHIVALQAARPLSHVGPEDQDLLKWLDDAVESGELKFKPDERRSRAKTLSVFGNRLRAHYNLQNVIGGYDVLRDFADRVRDVKEGGKFSLTDEERKALQEAHEKGPLDDNLYGDDKKVSWLSGAVEKGQFKTTEKNRRSRVKTIRTLAYRLHDEKEMEARSTRSKQARCLHELGEAVYNTSVIMETDLRHINRESDLVECTVYISDGDWNHPRGDLKKWLVLGQVQLRTDLHPMELKAYLPEGVTDFEHDSAWAMILPLIGVKFDTVRYHTTILEAYVAPRSLEDFHVPWPGYNPMEMEDATNCDLDRCEEDPHLMVGEDSYTPYNDSTLYRAVEGRFVRIRIGPRHKGE